MTTDIINKDQKIKDVAHLLKDLLKVIKVVSMYPEDNPLPQSLKRSFSDSFEAAVDQHGDIHLKITENSLTMFDEPIFIDKTKEERLAGIFFDAGLTEISFLAGFNLEQSYELLDILKRYVNSNDRSLDLAGLFWEKSLPQLKIKTLEDVALADYDDNFDLKDFISVDDTSMKFKHGFLSEDENQYQSIFVDDEKADEVQVDPDFEVRETHDDVTPQEDDKERSIFFTNLDETGQNIKLKTAQAATAMGYNDLPVTEAVSERPDTSIILNEEAALSEQEELQVQLLLRKDAEFDPFESIMELIKEMLLQESEMNSFHESTAVADKIIVEFLSHGRLAEAASILKFIKKLGEKIKKEKPLWSQRLKESLITASAHERMHFLAGVLNAHPDINPVELNSYLENFGWEAVNAVTDLISLVDLEQHRECLNKFLIEQGKTKVDVIAKNIYNKNPEIVSNAIYILVKIGDDRCMTYLKKLTDHKDDGIRLALVESLNECQHDGTLEILHDAVFDYNPRIRKKAVSNLVERKDQKAFEVIKDVIHNPAFIKMGELEQASLLNAYSVIGGEYAVPYLVAIATKYNPFHLSKLKFFRKAAFKALALNKSEKCEKALTMMKSTWRSEIRQYAIKTIQKRRDHIYGG